MCTPSAYPFSIHCSFPCPRVITYTYDPLHRLTRTGYSSDERFEYVHDTVGNPVCAARDELSPGADPDSTAAAGR